MMVTEYVDSLKWTLFLGTLSPYLMGTSIHILEVIVSHSKYVVVHLVPHS